MSELHCPECNRNMMSPEPGTISYTCMVPGCLKIRFCCCRCICLHMGKHIKEIKQQRDDLLAACEFAVNPEAPYKTDQLEFANNIIEAIAGKAETAIALCKT